MNWECRLPSLAEDALDIFSAPAEDKAVSNTGEIDEDGVSKASFTKEEKATAILLANEGLTNGDPAYVLDLLYRRGYIYYVDDDFYITPADN